MREVCMPLLQPVPKEIRLETVGRTDIAVLNGLHRSLFKGVIWQRTSTLTFRIALWIPISGLHSQKNETRNGRQNRNRKRSSQVTFQRGHLTKMPISILTTISNLIFWDLRCKDLNGLHRSLFKGVISQHTSTLTIQDCLLNSNVRIAFWISMIISSLIFSWMGCTTVSIWGVIGIRVNMLSTGRYDSFTRVTWLTRKCNFRSFRRHDSFENVIFDLSGDMTHSQNVWLVNTYRWNDSFKMSQVTVTWLIRKFEGEMTYFWWWHDWFEKVGGDREEIYDTNAMSSPTYSHLPHAKKPVSEKSVTNALHQRNVYSSHLENTSRTQWVIYISP